MRRVRELPAFKPAEFEQRVDRARALMTRARLDALLLTSEQNLEYLSGFTTQFAWNTPTRPWYFLLPRRGEATGVIPEVGITNWQTTSWCQRLLTWPSPRPDDDGLTLLADAIGRVSEAARRVHDLLWRATSAGIAACVPGHTAEQVFEAQAMVLVGDGMTPGNVGRFRHGLGKHLTEPPSNRPGDLTRLEPGMVLTVEPSAMYGRGCILVHEENVLVTEDGPRLLTRRAPRDMPVLTL